MLLLNLAMLLLLLFSHGLSTQSAARTPGPKEPARKLILDALRGPVEKELRQKVVFKVDHLKMQDGWAFMRGVPRQTGGAAIDYRGTTYDQARKDGVFDDWICALLRERAGRWEVVTYVIGATDVVYEGWEAEHKAPAGIFKE